MVEESTPVYQDVVCWDFTAPTGMTWRFTLQTRDVFRWQLPLSLRFIVNLFIQPRRQRGCNLLWSKWHNWKEGRKAYVFIAEYLMFFYAELYAVLYTKWFGMCRMRTANLRWALHFKRRYMSLEMTDFFSNQAIWIWFEMKLVGQNINTWNMNHTSPPLTNQRFSYGLTGLSYGWRPS